MEVSIYLGMDYISRFDVPKAIDCFEKSLDIAENAGDQATEGKAALTLGIFYQSEGNFLFESVGFYRGRSQDVGVR